MYSPWRSVKGHVYNYLKCDGHELQPNKKFDHSRSSHFCTATSGGKKFFTKISKSEDEKERIKFEFLVHVVLQSVYKIKVKLLHIDEIGNCAMTTEWIGDEDLCDIALSNEYRSDLKNGAECVIDTVLKIAQDVCVSLQTMHENKIIHCDVKVENIVRGCKERKNKDLEYFLVDFGLSQRWTGEREKLGGTYMYADAIIQKKEYIRNFECACSSDLWQLGITLCVMLTGGGFTTTRNEFAYECRDKECVCKECNPDYAAYKAVYCSFYQDIVAGYFKCDKSNLKQKIPTDVSGDELRRLQNVFEKSESFFGCLYASICNLCKQRERSWEFFMIMLSVVHPFPEMRISILSFKKQLKLHLVKFT